MSFYTNVEFLGDVLYERGVSDGKRYGRKVWYKPTIYLPSPEGRFRTLTNKPVAPMQFASIKECRQFVDQYKDVENHVIYGHTQFIYPYIAETFPDDLSPDLSQVRIVAFDIEAASENGFY